MPHAHAPRTPVPRQLSHRAREIFSKFLGSKATTPVNIDSQAQLADDILSAPHPDMFKEQQLQVTPRLAVPQGLPAGAGGPVGGGRLWWEEPSRPLGLGLRAWQTGGGSGGATRHVSATARPPADGPSGHMCTRVCRDSQARSGDAGLFGIFSILGHCCDERRTSAPALPRARVLVA